MAKLTPSSCCVRALRRKGFTLIELLVVIGVIAVLIGLLLPSMAKARDTGRTVKCLVNSKQMAQAAVSYAMDFKEQIWPIQWRSSWPNGPLLPNTDPGGENIGLWAMINTNGVRRPGFLFQYVSDAHEIVNCPTNKRRRGDGQVAWNLWGVDLGVQFDYTMLDEVEGTRLSSTTNIVYLPPGSTAVNTYSIPFNDTMVRMRHIPLFFEESTRWYNQSFRDGRFGNLDQVTTRHEKGGHVNYVDGSAELFKAPNDGDENRETVNKDWSAKLMFASNTPSGNRWFAVGDADGRPRPTAANRYGFLNQPQ
jgi:prepilin-type N-terminal cleavage/methylation domain-containing protein